MLHISDQMVDAVVTAQDAREVLLAAFSSYAKGGAAMQKRIRTQAGGVKLSTLGAVIPDQGVAGAKVYTTIEGRFTFVILLFSAIDGRPLATFDAGAITRIRTAACSVLAAKRLARPDAKSLGIFGAGVQGFEHAIQLAAEFPVNEILVSDPYASPDLVQRLQLASGVNVRMVDPEVAAANSDIIVTASRSPTPLFKGMSLRRGAFIAAIGSSLPHTRELDDDVLKRAKAIVVEWREQALEEAGDLILPAAGVIGADKIVELADVLTGVGVARESGDEIFVYKSVGIGLEDIALAGHAYGLISAA